MELSRFIEAHLSRPWQPGKVDCLLALADWCVHLGYPDPAATLRDQYDSEAGFQAIIEGAGGVIPLVQGCADFLGVERVREPHHGYAAVIGGRMDIQRQWGAIYDGVAQGWRVRFKDAYPEIKARPLAIWRL